MVCDPKKQEEVKEKLRDEPCQKARAVVWQLAPTFKEAVPPPPHQGVRAICLGSVLEPIRTILQG